MIGTVAVLAGIAVWLIIGRAVVRRSVRRHKEYLNELFPTVAEEWSGRLTGYEVTFIPFWPCVAASDWMEDRQERRDLAGRGR